MTSEQLFKRHIFDSYKRRLSPSIARMLRYEDQVMSTPSVNIEDFSQGNTKVSITTPGVVNIYPQDFFYNRVNAATVKDPAGVGTGPNNCLVFTSTDDFFEVPLDSYLPAIISALPNVSVFSQANENGSRSTYTARLEASDLLSTLMVPFNSEDDANLTPGSFIRLDANTRLIKFEIPVSESNYLLYGNLVVYAKQYFVYDTED